MNKKFSMFLGAVALVIAGICTQNPALVGSGVNMAVDASAQEA